MSALLPSAISSALESMSEGLSRSDLVMRSAAITAGYKNRLNSSKELRVASDALAYALARMPATYAASRRALLHLAEAMPNAAPNSLLDVGCGPGTASFAAHAVFPEIADFTMLDRNGPFLDLARQLVAVALPENGFRIIDQDIAKIVDLPKADLVVASYVLAELSPAVQTRFLAQLWDSTSQALVLVEPGTPDGFERLRLARISLIDAGAFIAAPCTHEGVCLKHTHDPAKPEWCRFLERVQRSRDHRILKSADRPFEDEPYAYLAVVRERPSARFDARIVGRTSTSKFEIQLPICDTNGLSTLKIPKRNKKRYKNYNGLEWGDAVLKQGPNEEDERS
jgi:ribosomal protein RSM22 (predicted rRNA methylase)